MEINGKKVVNGQKPFTLRITVRDIRRSKSRDPGACAAAVALMRENKDIKSARVHVGRIFVEAPSAWVRYKTPKTLRDEIIAYDRGGRFVPGDHVVVPLTKSEQLYIESKAWRKENRDRSKDAPRDQRKRRTTHIVPDVRARGANR
jgi:hypothetical protein